MGESRIGVQEQDPVGCVDGGGEDMGACRGDVLGDVGQCDPSGRDDESRSAKAERSERVRATDASGILYEVIVRNRGVDPERMLVEKQRRGTGGRERRGGARWDGPEERRGAREMAKNWRQSFSRSSWSELAGVKRE